MSNTQDFEDNLTASLKLFGINNIQKSNVSYSTKLILEKSIIIDGNHEVIYHFYEDLSLQHIQIYVRQTFFLQDKNDAIDYLSKVLLCCLIALGEKVTAKDILLCQTILAGSRSREFENCNIGLVTTGTWEASTNQGNNDNFLAVSINPKKKPLLLSVDSFTYNFNQELKKIGSKTKVDKRKNGDVFFNAPDRCAMSGSTKDGYLTALDYLITYSGFWLKSSREKHLVNAGKYYYACGMAIDPKGASQQAERFLSLQGVALQHFNSTVFHHQSSASLSIKMSIY